ncbi:MAG TPA: alanine racemase [Gemmatimonadales bacterium]|jgi:D-serine deaminase-like pyridoxal phosphate-dependent protein
MNGSIHGAPALETPVPLVDLDRLESNLDRMAAYARSHRLALRPHTKTHKSSRVGGDQVRRGAVGLTCATLLEVEIMAEVAGDILLAYPPVGRSKLERLMELPVGLDLTVALDSLPVAEQLARAARERGRTIGVYLELDLGLRRVGLAGIEDVLTLARAVATMPPLEYRGITFYPGHIRGPVASHTPELDRLGTALQVVIGKLRAAGLEPKVVSGGSTPTVWRSHEIDGVTEIRPGTYVYNDRTTAQIGACAWNDCALTVLATVVSTAVPGQAVIDAGSKALGREPGQAEGDGFGALLDRPEVTVQRLSEEHGILDLGDSGWRPAVGELVRVVPNHVCIAVHLHEVIYGIRGDRIETSWPVLARGRRPMRPPAGV